MASPGALHLHRLHVDHCSARTDCRGRIDPMSPLWGRGGRQCRAPQGPGCRRGAPMRRYTVHIQTASLNPLDLSQVSIWEGGHKSVCESSLEKEKVT